MTNESQPPRRSGVALLSGVILPLLLFIQPTALAYTVLTHEAIIDSVWDTSLVKVLLRRFPNATPEELKRAHAYAYGGSIIQDMGYYPFGSRFFSDLTHYVRSGDFIVAMLEESKDLNEYAFALGALEHYAADIDGHRLGTNLAVALLYPKLGRKFGRSVTYWDDPLAHIRTEFGFDVVQVGLGRYAPDQYHNFIGFEVSKDLLERAFKDTYAFEMKEIFASLPLAFGSYRHGVSSIVPEMTKVAWKLKRDRLQKEIPGITRRKFLYNLSRASYEKDWGREYQKPGFGTSFLAFIVRLIPKGGPFRSLTIAVPTPQVEQLFMASFNATVDRYKALLATAGSGGKLNLENENFDIGEPTRPGKYKGADEAYAKLLGKLADHKFADMPDDLRRDILQFYGGWKPPVQTAGRSPRKGDPNWGKVSEELESLRAVRVAQP